MCSHVVNRTPFFGSRIGIQATSELPASPSGAFSVRLPDNRLSVWRPEPRVSLSSIQVEIKPSVMAWLNRWATAVPIVNASGSGNERTNLQ